MRRLTSGLRLPRRCGGWGDQKGQEALVQATVSGYASDQMIAVLALAEPHDTRMLEYVAGLFQQ